MEEKIHILLVDDEPDFIEPISFWLKANGYPVLIASNGQEALETVKKNKPDMVFLDIKMPGMDGIETLKRIREFNKELPVIILTAYPTIEHFSQTQKLNVSGFFDKAGNMNELRKIIDFTLNTYKKVWKK
ncbi:response regulator [Candidatus Omnitrophota bacterium]